MWLNHQPWKYWHTFKMCHLGTREVLGILKNVKGLFQCKWFFDSMTEIWFFDNLRNSGSSELTLLQFWVFVPLFFLLRFICGLGRKNQPHNLALLELKLERVTECTLKTAAGEHLSNYTLSLGPLFTGYCIWMNKYSRWMINPWLNYDLWLEKAIHSWGEFRPFNERVAWWVSWLNWRSQNDIFLLRMKFLYL